MGPSQPRRPRPPAGAPKRPGAQPSPVPQTGDPDGTTFRPSPARPGSSSRTRAGAGAKSAKGLRSTEFASEYREPLAPGPKWWERIFFGRVSSGQLAQFCRQFASYLNAGVDYSRTFSSLENQFAGSALGPAVGRMRLAIKGGSTLEEAMAREPQIFSTMFLSMIRVAEARGGVPETLRMMGNHYEARQRLIRQARSAMIYPVIVLTMAGGVIALLTIVLLPMFASMLKDIDRRIQLPLPSRALLAFSNFVGWVGWWLIPLVLVGTPFLIYRFYKTAPGKALIVALAPSGQFSPDVLAVLQTGEETGKVPESLNHLADDYEEQVSGMVKNLGHLVQPLLVAILGGVVFFIILAVFLPYIQMITSLASP